MEPEKWRTFKLRELDVYNNNNEHVGDIRELLQDRGGKIVAVVIGVGGFLGMGAHDVALPFGQMHWVEKGSSTTGSTGSWFTASRSPQNSSINSVAYCPQRDPQ
jgi:hypothetical protein